MHRKEFDPFQDRLSRDIRNDLSKTLPEVLEKRDMETARDVAGRYLNDDPAPCYVDYIQARLAAYEDCLEEIQKGSDDFFRRALVLWDRKLFFEVHEVLENAWIKKEGEEKLVLQAMIRAAGVYIKMEYGYTDSARKIARRAIPILEQYRNYLVDYFDPGELLLSLKDLRRSPPVLLASSRNKVR